MKGLSRQSQWIGHVEMGGHRYSRTYCDSAHGGSKKARAKAEKWIRAKRRELGLPDTEARIMVCPSWAKSNSLPVGVTYYTRRDGRARPHYRATLMHDGVQEAKYFFVSVHGNAEAKRKAVAFRKYLERKFWGGAIKAGH